MIDLIRIQLQKVKTNEAKSQKSHDFFAPPLYVHLSKIKCTWTQAPTNQAMFDIHRCLKLCPPPSISIITTTTNQMNI